MTSIHRIFHVLSLCFILFGGAASASPLPPIIRSVLSEDGHSLVYSDIHTEPAGNGPGQHVLSVTYHVLTRRETAHNGQWINAPGAFWTDFSEDWSVTLDGSDALLWPLISNDGASLVLLSQSRPGEPKAALRVYRRSSQGTGKLVRTYSLSDFWTPIEVYPQGDHIVAIFDSTPLWFTGGVFTFLNSAELSYTNQWHETTRIDLTTGALQHER